MNITRDRIVSTALLKLGETSFYNDNKSDIYKRADFLLDNVINTVGARVDFLFNSVTVTLTLNLNKKNEIGEYRYNIPGDFLGKISFIDSTGRFENEFIYSTDEIVRLQYCKTMDLSDYPFYLQNYMIYALAVEMAETSTQYKDNLSLLNVELEKTKRIVYDTEYTPEVRVMP